MLVPNGSAEAEMWQSVISRKIREETMNSFQKEKLVALVSHPVKWGCMMSIYTSFSIGGPAEAIVTVDQREELVPLLKFFKKEEIIWRVIGRGTNLLVADRGFPGVILLLGREFQAISGGVDRGDGKVCVRAGSGCSLGRFSLSCMEKGLAGLEFAGGIPGSVGGAVIMNAGAWGEDISSIVNSIIITSETGEKELKREDLHFEYRCWKEYSDISGGAVISEVEFLLRREDSEKIRARCRRLQEKRRSIQPNSFANAGSFFKNPENDSAGRLIEASGFKGVRVGDAMVSEKHANFLVNCGKATAGDVLTLMNRIQEKVKEDSGVELQPEVHFI